MTSQFNEENETDRDATHPKAYHPSIELGPRENVKDAMQKDIHGTSSHYPVLLTLQTSETCVEENPP
jgi:hypothetical protein